MYGLRPFLVPRGAGNTVEDKTISSSLCLAQSGFWQLSPYFIAAGVLAVVMLLWDTVEVGRNDAANIINSVIGARILPRRWAIRVAGLGVILGAWMSSDVIETARKGIFTPSLFSIEQALAIYISVYLIDTILLYAYSAFGMPVSTTMTLVFSLLGASLFLGVVRDGVSVNAVNWINAGQVILGIVCSIVLSGIMGFLLQRAARGALRGKGASLTALLLHGAWIGGGLMAGLSYFMLVKGMKNVGFVKHLKKNILQHELGPILAILAFWVFFGVLIHFALVIYRKRAAVLLFPVLTVIGMFAMAFAFGQNDLANCASPGLAAIELIKGHLTGLTVAAGTAVPIDHWALLGCGILLTFGMMSKNAQRVTKTAVSAGSAGDYVELWAPRWCLRLAGFLISKQRIAPSLSPAITKTSRGKTLHYDPLRACVIVCVSACVIATASALKLPVSTTYVAFASVVATGMADRVFVRGDAALKLGRSIWVVFSWFAAAAIATVAAGVTCLVVYHAYRGGVGPTGMVVCILANLAMRRYVKRRADLLEARVYREAEERMFPDDFSREDE